MNKTLKALFALPLVASLAFAGDAKSDKDLKKVIEDQGIYVETSQKGIVLSGYADAGYTYNFNSGNNASAQKFGNDGGVASQQQGDFNLNAFKLALEKPLSDKNELTAGFRADLMVGEDASFLRGNGVGTAADGLSELYVHQAFVQFRAPVGNGIDFKVGKFATPMGYEVAERPANLNYSYGLLWQNLQPLSHTGILASYKVNDIVTTEFGVVNADWNNADSVDIRGSGNGNSNVGLLASVNVKSKGGNANIKNTFYGATRGGRNVVTAPTSADSVAREGSLFMWDSWGNWAPKFANDKLLLGYNTDFGLYEGYQGLIADGTKKNDETFWGAAVYAKYQFTKIFSLAGRAEYIHGTDGAKFGNVATATTTAGIAQQDLFSYTATAGFNIYENMILRAEYRADFGNNVQGVNNNATAHMLSANVVYSF
ncbi:MAG: outer membrane beta-barrel protein [Verrucomicrobiota bacterium]